MAKLHYKTLAAAVTIYGALLTQGKSTEDIKAAIAADEKGFEPDQIEEIFNAITESDNGGEDSQGNNPDDQQHQDQQSSDDDHKDDLSNPTDEEFNKFIETLTPELGQRLFDALVDKFDFKTINVPDIASGNAAESEKVEQLTGKHVVTTAFRDVSNFDLSYQPGDDVSHLDKKRLKDLVSKGFVVKK